MAQTIPARTLSVQPGYTIGVGISAADGTPMNTAVTGDVSAPEKAEGEIQQLTFSQVSSTADLETKLNIDASASYGGFGAGASARFGFARDAKVNTSSIYTVISGSAATSTQSINNIRLTDDAAQVVGDPAVFSQRFGDMFLRTLNRGGIFVGIYRIDVSDESTKTDISAELKGSYGVFSADVTGAMESIAKRQNVEIFCQAYAEGGPPLNIKDPRNPNELLEYADAWFAALSTDPDRYSVAYSYLAQPLSLANGPIPPNIADLLLAQDVLEQCYAERVRILDDLNLYEAILAAQDRFVFVPPTTINSIKTAYDAESIDLKTVALAASQAMNDPKSACSPAEYAQTKGRQLFPSVPPQPLPTLQPGKQAPRQAVGPFDLVGKTVTELRAICQQYGIRWADASLVQCGPATVGQSNGAPYGALAGPHGILHNDDHIVVIGQAETAAQPPAPGAVVHVYLGLAAD